MKQSQMHLYKSHQKIKTNNSSKHTVTSSLLVLMPTAVPVSLAVLVVAVVGSLCVGNGVTLEVVHWSFLELLLRLQTHIQHIRWPGRVRHEFDI